MTVAELRAALEEYPDEREVVVVHGDGVLAVLAVVRAALDDGSPAVVLYPEAPPPAEPTT